VNTDVLWPEPEWAEMQVLRIQTKLHQWASVDPDRRFDDLFNLVYDPAVLVVAWARVRGNRGKRSAGVDGIRPDAILSAEEEFLPRLREDLKARQFAPLPVRERMIPKPGSSKRRRLGIPTARDRTVQAALKLVLEPIFEADFKPCSYGFRPRRRAHDAIAEIHQFASRSYEWVLEGDIEACFDMIDHTALTDRVRHPCRGQARPGTGEGALAGRHPLRGRPPAEYGHRHTPRRDPLPAASQYRLVRPGRALRSGMADGQRHRQPTDQATPKRARQLPDRPLRGRLRGVGGRNRGTCSGPAGRGSGGTCPDGLAPSEAKTRVCHIDQGFDFLGFRIQRKRKRGTNKRVVYTYPSKKALASIVGKVRALTRRASHPTLAVLLRQLNPVLRGWCAYFRYGVSKATFGYLDQYTWHRVVRWIRKRHNRTKWAVLLRRYLPGRGPTEDEVTLFDPQRVTVSRYRYRGDRIPSPWASTTPGTAG